MDFSKRKYWDRVVNTIVCILLLSVGGSCESDEEIGDDVLISADPPSIYKGDTVNIQLTSVESFFEKGIKTPIISAGNLMLKKITRKNNRKAIATLTTTDDTTIGRHNFVLDENGTKGKLSVSVLIPDKGPGEVKVERNKGSSGAKYAFFTIIGKGTDFDKNCNVKVIGAEGFDVKFVDVLNPRRVDIYYSIDIEQSPTDISILLMDGDFHYEVPFHIVKHKVFDNEIDDQSITKGMVGEILVFNKNATVDSSTTFEENYISLESGDALPNLDQSVTIPVRVPFDYEKEDLILIANTYTDGGSFLEQIRVNVTLNKPSFFFIKDGKIDLKYEEHERLFVIDSEDNWDPETIKIIDESGNVTITDWRMEDAKIGSLSILLRDGASEGPYTIIAENEKKQKIYATILVSNSNEKKAYIPDMTISIGDDIYLPVIVQCSYLNKDKISVSASEDILLSDVILLDKKSIVLRIKIDKNAFPSNKRIEITDSDHSYRLSVPVLESRL